MRPNLLLVIATSLLAASLPSQNTKPTSGKGQENGAEIAKPDVNKGVPEKPLAPGERPKLWVKPTPPKELAKAKAKLSGATAKVVSFESSCQPATVLAGERGTMRVLMLFRGDAVMIDPPPVTFKIEQQQGALTILGEPEFLPPERSGLAPALKNIPAYDKFAIFHVPFAVAADARPSQQRLALSVRYELYNGKKGGTVGTFTDHLGVDVNVVTEKPKAVLLTTPRRGGQTPQATAVGDTIIGAGNSASDPAMSGSANQVASAPNRNDGDSPDPAPSVGATTTPWTLYGAVGALLIAIVLLLARRR